MRTAPLLYWLLVVSGLAGVTILRFDGAPTHLAALWVGTVSGVALGQLLAALRVRAWVPLVAVLLGVWFVAPLAVMALERVFERDVGTFALAFVPAVVSGYLSLGGRGTLVSFWYPTVLWMMTILDGPSPGAFDPRASLPLLVGLTALFVAFFRARESRRVALFRSHAGERLATPVEGSVLRARPLRSISQHAVTAVAGAFGLVLASWIGPHLWQVERSKHEARAEAALAAADYAAPGALPCCPTSSATKERVREYFSLDRGAATEVAPACRSCAVTYEASSDPGSHGWSYGGTPGAGLGGGSAATPEPWTMAYGTSAWESAPPAYAPAAGAPAPYDVPPAKPPPPSAASPRSTDVAPGAGASHARRAHASAPDPSPGAPLRAPRAPWRWTAAASAAALGVWLALRAARRWLTLRHLERPVFPETLDQRISNHWERVLIALADAGIHPARAESPAAFARRIGIAGAAACAEVLERVRHGVRVDDADLEAMARGAREACRAARAEAGLVARATAWLRSPVA